MECKGFYSFIIAFCFAALPCRALPLRDPGDSNVLKVLRLPPGPDNPRNSECDFVTLKDGAILMIYSHFYGASSNDYATAHLASRISRDGGRTWSAEDKVEVRNEAGMNIMSVSLLRLRDGRIALFYARKNARTDCVPQIRYSDDEGVSWSDARPCITDQQGYFVLNNNRVIQLRTGRLLMPVSLHESPTQPWSSRGRIFCYYSDDNGMNWRRGREVANPDTVVTQEPGVVELANGRVLMFMRTNAGVQYTALSSSKGRKWTAAGRSGIASPVSPASIARVPGKRDLVMVWNNNDGSDPEIKGKRTPLNIAVSRDDGKSWEKTKFIETDKDGWYCYTALHFTGNKLLVGYVAGSQRMKSRLAQTDVSLVDLQWVYR